MSLDENPAGGNATAGAWPRVESLDSPEPATRLWWCTLRATPAQIAAWAGVLSEGERTRAARFAMPALRDRYVIGRTALRTVLADALGTTPADVAIVRGERGRPRLADDVGIDFNLSHTQDVALVGLARGGRIGVDVERGDRRINVAGIARKFLTGAERAAIASIDEDAARRVVLTLWTCKEAMSKATGDALSAPFARIDVDLSEGRTLRGGPGRYRPGDWALHAARVPAGHVATVARWRP